MIGSLAVAHKSPRRRAREKHRWFRSGQHFHAGVERRISVLSRKYGLDHCWNRGRIGFQQCVGWDVLANNLMALGRGLTR